MQIQEADGDYSLQLLEFHAQLGPKYAASSKTDIQISSSHTNDKRGMTGCKAMQTGN